MNRRELLVKGAGAVLLVPASSALGISKLGAQDFALDPILVTAPGPILTFAEFSEITAPNFALQNAQGPLLQYNSYINWYLPNKKAALARAAAEEAAADPTSKVIYGPEPSFANNYSSSIAVLFTTAGLYWAEALAASYFLEGAGNTLSEAMPAVRVTAQQLIYEGLAAGTIGSRVLLFGTGLTVGLTGVTLLAAGLALIGITLYYVVPEIERQLRATSNSTANYTGMLSLEPAP